MEESASLLECDPLICNWCALAIEYALELGKPMLFVNAPPRVRNPKDAELGLEPLEMRIRRKLGTVLPLDRLTGAGACGEAASRLGGVPHTVRSHAGSMGIQLRPERRGENAGDRSHRRRASGRRHGG
jgi:hypothetical protein